MQTIKIDDNTVEVDGKRYVAVEEQPKAYGDVVFDVEDGRVYYYVDSDNKVYEEKFDKSSKYQNLQMSSGIYLTFEAAEKAARQRKAVAKLMQSKGARPFVRGEDNWHCYYNHFEGRLLTEWGKACETYGIVYFDTEENALAAYEAVKQDLWGV